MIARSNTSITLANNGSEPAISIRPGAPTDNLLEIVWRRRWIVAVVTCVCLISAFAYLQMAVPQFTSTSRIYVEQIGPQILDDQVIVRQSDSYLYTQAELLKSTPVLATAVEESSADRMESFADIDNLVAYLKEELDVAIGKKDDIISVSFESPYPDEAARLVNTVVDAYIVQHVAKKRSTASEVLKLLTTEKDKRDIELENRRQALWEFRRQNASLILEDGKGSVVIYQFSKSLDELTKIKWDVIDAKVAYEVAARLYKVPDQHQQLLDAAIAQGIYVEDRILQMQILQLELELAVAREKFGIGHPEVISIKEPLEKLMAKFQQRHDVAVRAYLEALDQEYSILKQKEQGIQESVNKQHSLAIQMNLKLADYAILQDALSRTERLSDILDDRIRELNVTEDAGALNISILEVARPEDKPSSPQKARVVGLGLVAGLMLGFGLALLRDLLDTRFRSAEDICAVLESPVLGNVPHTAKQRAVLSRIVEAEPMSASAEAYRTIRTAIYFGLPDDDTKTVLVTSPLPKDGKSTTASNLAIAMAQADKRVLLLDADFRRPVVHSLFGLASDMGLSNVLARQGELADAIFPTDIERLDVLPCGPIPHNPTEMLDSERFKNVLEMLSEQYDQIVIDSPPVLPVADARILGAICDITLLVLRAGKSTRKLSVDARNGLLSVGARLLGVVVNDIPQGKGRYGYNKYGNYSYGGYYRAENGADNRLVRETDSSPATIGQD